VRDFAGQPVLVTGASGFVGSHLLPALAAAFPAAELHGTCRDGSLPSQAQVVGHALDLSDTAATLALVQQLRPAAIVNLAAFASVSGSFAQPERCWQINLHGTLNLLTAAAALEQPPVFLQIGSGDMYGASFKRHAEVDEQVPLHPLNPYTASKAAADLAAAQFAATSRVRVIRARPFNHSGAGQGKGYVLTDFASQIAAIERGEQPPVLRVGDLSAQRDFLAVQDVVAAYVALLGHSEGIPSGTALNIASGRPLRVQELLDALIDQAACPIQVEQDPARLRPSDIARAVGDAGELRRLTGWQPRIEPSALVAQVLADWRQSGS